MTVSENLRLQGFKANRSARGKTLALDRTGATYIALVNVIGDVDYYGDGNVQNRSEVHILRSDIGDTLPGADDVFTDDTDDLRHVITDPPDWQTDSVVVRFRCRVEVNT